MKALSFSEFLETPQGRLLGTWEQTQYDEFVSDAFGWHALQIGATGIDTLRQNRISSQWLCDDTPSVEEDPALRPDLLTVRAESGWLPFPNDSFDLVTLPHTLDFSPSAHQTLREAERVLAPEGRIVLTVFNPLSLWWLRQRCVAWGLSPYLPTRTAPIPLYRLKDWLMLLGFEIDRGRFGIYSPSCHSLKNFRHWKWLDKAGDRWAPHCANLIVLSAVKRLPGMKLIGKPTVKRPLSILPASAPIPVPKEGGAQALQPKCQRSR